MKKIAIIEAALTIVLLSSFVGLAKMASWIRSIPESAPAHHVWQSRLALFDNVWTYVLFFPWIIFTVLFLIASFVHLGAWIFRKLTPEDNKDG